MKINITHIDTACILLEINGYKILTDPTLDNSGSLYHHGFGSMSRKTGTPSLNPDELFDIDLVLLSHHQHKDNFDIKGRELALKVSKIISTKQAEKVLKNAVGLDNWETHQILTDKCSNLRITATPAQHRPWWIPKFFSGNVIGFIIEFDEQKDGVIYISGDTVYFNGIDEVASKYKIDIGVFHVGSAQFRYLTGFGQYTMDSKDLVKAVKVLNPNVIVPIHHNGWSHFKESDRLLYQTLSENEFTKKQTTFLTSGQKTTIGK
ncbi:MAG: MBL fold metallo-hydrolase [Bacteroidales bacterium]|nr:MBL fold metallo-hydrolase [Bacteroidales bacterium]